MRYAAEVGTRIEVLLASVLPMGTSLEVRQLDERVAVARIGSTHAVVAWASTGWPGDVREVCESVQGLDLVVAPTISLGARDVLAEHAIGWADETGAAQFFVGPVVVARDGTTRGVTSRPTSAGGAWTPTTLGVVEALLTGTPATVAAVQRESGLSVGACTGALSVLSARGLLESSEARGPGSGRRVVDPLGLLQIYADESVRLRRGAELRVGALWQDPVAGAADRGALWRRSGRRWAATGALAAAVMSPLLTHVAPLVIYVDAASMAELTAAAHEADLLPADGGRLTLRRFPGPVTRRLSQRLGPLECAPWPRVFADLRGEGVRGEEAADHLAQEQLRQSARRE